MRLESLFGPGRLSLGGVWLSFRLCDVRLIR